MSQTEMGGAPHDIAGDGGPELQSSVPVRIFRSCPLEVSPMYHDEGIKHEVNMGNWGGTNVQAW